VVVGGDRAVHSAVLLLISFYFGGNYHRNNINRKGMI